MQKKAIQLCPECYGDGEMSECCNGSVDADISGKKTRCAICNKFCRIDICHECQGEGEIIYRIGVPVEFYVDRYSPQWLQELLYRPKPGLLNNTKGFKGTIVDIVDHFTVYVKIKYSGQLLKLPVEEIIY